MPRPLISVILPTRSRPHLLPRAVASVFNQTFRDFDVWVVDDSPIAERAANRDALKPWAQDARLHYLPHDGAINAAAARNFGLDQVEGEWVTFLDDDDAYALDKLDAQWRRVQATSSPVVLCGAMYHLGARKRLRHCDREEYVGAELLLDAQSGSPFMFHRRTTSVRFNENLFAGEDLDYFLLLAEHFGVTRVPSVPQPLVNVYPQAGYNRVNVRADALRASQRLVCLKHAVRFGKDAQRHAIARAELLRCRWRKVSLRTLIRASRRLWRIGGKRELRLIVNTWLLQVPGLRRFLVT